jgi:hypothetical protein
MAQNKMTKKDWYAVLVEIVGGSDYADKDGALEFIAHEVELLSKKSGKSGMTKVQKENEVLVEEVYAELGKMSKPMTVTELQGASPVFAKFSNQKLSALLKKLVDAGRIDKAVDGKKSYFSVSVEVDETEVDTDEVDEVEVDEVEGE